MYSNTTQVDILVMCMMQVKNAIAQLKTINYV
jgi:hypothetical protein